MGNKIEFRSTSDNTWVMRITADRKIEVNEDVDVTFAAQKVLDAMQGLLTPQRTWVELTDGEIEARAINFYNPEMYKRAVLWAQEKLKERNQ